MADNNLFKGLKPDTKLSRNGFDWSGRDVMSWQAGALYPIWSKSLIPGEHVKLNINHILRTFPMSAPNFNRNRAHFEFFFVPYSQIWKPWHELYLGRSDKQRTTDYTPSTCVPSFDVIGFKKALVDQLVTPSVVDVHGYRAADNAFRLMDLLGYGSTLGYQSKFAAFMRGETELSDVYETIKDCFGNSGVEYLNIFKIAAYQKIWADYYRDSVHDTSDYSFSFNFDDVYLNGSNNIVTSRGWSFNDLLSNVFIQRYRSYKKDIFTNAYPSQQFGDVSSVSFKDVKIKSDVSTAQPHSVNTDTVGYLTSTDGLGDTYREWDIPNGFDVYAFYRAEAVQLWRERVMRAGNRYKDNYKAHFGVVPKYLEDDYPDFVGSFSKMISVDDVTSTAETSEGSLGALAGKGIATDQTDDIEYDCKDFGVLMCIFSIVPEMDYNASGYDKDNMALVPEDFIIPEYDKLGLEPICLKEFTVNQPSVGLNIGHWGGESQPPSYTYQVFDTNQILGHNPRFYAHKSRVNKVHGRFQYNMGSSFLSTSGFSSGGYYNGDLSPFVQPMQKIINNRQGFPIGSHYINPNITNCMFSVICDGTEATDRFFGAVQVNCQSIQPLSVAGLHAI